MNTRSASTVLGSITTRIPKRRISISIRITVLSRRTVLDLNTPDLADRRTGLRLKVGSLPLWISPRRATKRLRGMEHFRTIMLGQRYTVPSGRSKLSAHKINALSQRGSTPKSCRVVFQLFHGNVGVDLSTCYSSMPSYFLHRGNRCTTSHQTG